MSTLFPTSESTFRLSGVYVSVSSLFAYSFGYVTSPLVHSRFHGTVPR